MVPERKSLTTNWFKYNNFKANATKSHFFLSSYQSAIIKIDGSIIKNNNLQNILGVTIHSNFTLVEHIYSVCQKSSQKLHALPKYHNIYHQIRSALSSKQL